MEVGRGVLSVFPPRGFDYLFKPAETSFPPGSCLEYHIETGDLFFDRDHGEVLGLSLWVVRPDGTRKVLVSEYAHINVRLVLRNLLKLGIPLRVIKVYDGPIGEHTEVDVTEEYSKRKNISWLAVLVGSSSLWLGALAGALVREVAFVAVIGVLGFAVLSMIAILASSATPATRIIRAATTLPSYTAGYALAAVVARYFAAGSRH